jgi:hypothetical protein
MSRQKLTLVSVRVSGRIRSVFIMGTVETTVNNFGRKVEKTRVNPNAVSRLICDLERGHTSSLG